MNKTNRILSLLLIVQLIVIQVVSKFPEFIENRYSNGVYPLISRLFRTLFGWIPFSVGDVFYLLIIALFLREIYQMIRRKTKTGKSLLKITAGISVLYFFFYSLWGLNYFREDIYTRMNLSEKKPEKAALQQLTEEILNHLKKNQLLLTGNDSLPVAVSYDKNTLLGKTPEGYRNLAKSFPQYAYHPVSLKKSLFSTPLTYMGFSGYFNPFTGEAQVDHLVPKVSLPVICSHEVAHQLGIASESGANFTGFLAAFQHDDPVFKYSALLMAYRFALSDLYKTDQDLYQQFVKKTPGGILQNIREINNFWKQYENLTEPFFKLFYDNYLKVNKQKHGIKSYNRMVGLLIAYDERYGLWR